MNPSSFYIKVSELPVNLQKALDSVGHGSKDVRIEVSQEFHARPPSAEGRRGFLTAVNLNEEAAEPFKTTIGSWGGANIFVKTIDDTDAYVAIPSNGAFISGLLGNPGHPAYAVIHVGPSTMNPKLLPPAPSVSDKETKILCAISYKSGYRKQYLDELKASQSEIDNLVARGFISRNARGAMSLTTLGKNSKARNPY